MGPDIEWNVDRHQDDKEMGKMSDLESYKGGWAVQKSVEGELGRNSGNVRPLGACPGGIIGGPLTPYILDILDFGGKKKRALNALLPPVPGGSADLMMFRILTIVGQKMKKFRIWDKNHEII